MTDVGMTREVRTTKMPLMRLSFHLHQIGVRTVDPVALKPSSNENRAVSPSRLVEPLKRRGK